MKLCIIMRGLPGSSREEIAAEMVDGLKCAEIRAEQYFADKGEVYDYKKLPEAYHWCFDKFKEYVKEGLDILLNHSNVKTYHFRHYQDYAQRNGYSVAIVTVEHPNPRRAAEKTGIPESTIRKMMVDWEA